MTTPTTTTAFADLSDVEARCIRTLTSDEQARAQILLLQAANKIRAYCRRGFDRKQSTITARALGGTVVLADKPVISVDGLQLVDYLGNKFTVPAFGFDQIDRIDLSFYGTVLNLPESLSFNSTWSGTVIVTYTHGYATIPDDIVDLNADLVARVFNTPGSGAVGVRSQTVGPYSVSFDTSLTSGVVMFTDDDKKLVLNKYRPAGVTTELR